MTELTDKDKAELSEVVDGAICCADVVDWESLADFEEEILSAIEAWTDLGEAEHAYCETLVAEYWREHGGDDDREEEEQE
jgi:hypothetical protein